MTKATHRKTTVDVIKEQRKAAKKQFGLSRQSVSGISAASSIGVLSQQSQGGSAGDNTNSFLRTSGDTMVGPFAMWRGTQLFFPTSGNDNTLDISISGAYTSHWIWAVGGGSNQLEEIQNASFNGQLLFIESTASVTQTIKDESAGSLVASSPNIKTLDGNDLVLGTDKTIVLFMYTDIDAMWHQISNPSSVGVSLSGNNTWTGNNTFSGGTFASAATTSTSITSPAIYLGDAVSDAIYISGTLTTDLNIANTKSIYAASGSSNFIGFHVTDETDVGSLGTVELPYLRNSTYTTLNLPSYAVLDGMFGDFDGACGFWSADSDTAGVVRELFLWRSNGGWKQVTGATF